MTDLDREFARFCERGDTAALGRVYDATAAELFALAARLLADPVEAEDVVQATFVAAIESARAFDKTQRVMPWLVGILNHRVQHARRRRAREAERPAPEPRRLTELGPEAREFDAQVAAALDAIGEPYRAVLVLRLLHGMDPAQIAYALQRPPATVRSQLARGLERLRAKLPRCYAAPAALGLPVAWQPRGLDVVREVILAHAHAQLATGVAALGAATAGSTVQAGVFGKFVQFGVIMSQTSKVAVAVVATVIAGLLFLTFGDRTGGDGGSKSNTGMVETIESPIPRVEANAGEFDEGTNQTPDGRPARAPIGLERAILRVGVTFGGQPLAAVPIYVHGGSGGHVPRFRATDPDGFATFEFDASAGAVQGRVASPSMVGDVGFEAPVGVVTTLQIEANPPGRARGIVRDEFGSPIEGAIVWTSPQLGGQVAEDVARTAADGRFEVPIWTRSRIGARAPGKRAAHRLCSVEPLATIDFDLVLRGGGSHLRGFVTGPDGLPVRAAELRVGLLELYFFEGDQRADGTSDSIWPARVFTDAEGAFEIDGLTPGPVRAYVRAPGFAMAARDVQLEPGATTDLAIALDRGATVSGRVLTATREPAAGAFVRYGDDRLIDGRSVRTAADGTFELGELPSGPIELAAELHRHGKASVVLELRAGSTAEWSPTLNPAHDRIRGRLVDDAGVPLVGWWLTAREYDSDYDRGAPTRSAADGSFEFGPLAALSVWRELRVHPPNEVTDAGAGGFPSEPAVVCTAPTAIGTTDVLIVVARSTLPSATVRGRVVAAAGSAPALSLRADDGTQVPLEWAEERSVFVSRTLRPGHYELLDSSRWPATVVRSFDLARGEALDLGEVEVPISGSGQLRFTLRMPDIDHRTVFDGPALIGVYGRDTDELVRWIAVSPDLRAVSLAAGDYRVRLVAAPVEPLVRDVQIRAGAETHVEWTPRQAALRNFFVERSPLVGPLDGRLRFEVRLATDPAGTPLYAHDHRGLDDGWFFAANLLPGRYRFTARTIPGGRFAADGEFEVRDLAPWPRPTLIQLQSMEPR